MSAFRKGKNENEKIAENEHMAVCSVEIFSLIKKEE